MDEICVRIFQELKNSGKIQKELAEYLGVTQQAVANWKQGRNTSYNKYIHGIAEFLGVSVEYLKGETDIKKPSIRLDRELSAHESVVLAAYRDQPAMQPAVDKLLGVDEAAATILPLDHTPPPPASESSSVVFRSAALGGRKGRQKASGSPEETEQIEETLEDEFSGF